MRATAVISSSLRRSSDLHVIRPTMSLAWMTDVM
eukprot:CAMPEP_0177582022 /NCGR_PEP_ID=MMETSP0419_2-20121207/2484_1 /TAXON_ID=582737 /ORGANISM="Tetraselmis sp., Strain GSL018" /LENGTH=33 /DNA_ID= /DNA_START= /DNA_END= /DNA_ORIENTATION=